MTEFNVETDVPIPKRLGGVQIKYPFGDMKVGDSFLFDAAKYRSVQSAASSYKRSHSSFAYKMRKFVNGTARLWRVEASCAPADAVTSEVDHHG
jgi:hypothetical protein